MEQFESRTASFCCAYKSLLRRYLNNLDGSQDKISPTDFDALVRRGERVGNHSILHDIQDLVEQIYARTGKLGFGLEIGRSLHHSDYGTLGFTLMNTPKIIDALSFATQYKHFVIEGFYAHIQQEGGLMSYQIDNEYQHTFMEPIIELDFASMIHFGRFLAGPDTNRAIELDYVHFMHQPHGAMSLYGDFFGCDVLFGQPVNKTATRRENIEVPVCGADANVFGLLEQQFRIMDRRTQESRPMIDRVSEFIHYKLGHETPDLQAAAEHFNMSISTLKKRLRNENTSYQRITDKVRMGEACRRIVSTAEPLKKVGLELGFSSPSAFNKAFRRWTGTNPAEYRRESQMLSMTS